MTVGWLFPGQGSQYVGMAMSWAARDPHARDAIDEASAVLGMSMHRLLAEGPEDVLADTHNQQPAVLAASIAIMRAAAGVIGAPSLVAGHSLGEYGALVAAGALDYPDALRLVRERGRLMREAGELSPGSMAAVLGLPDEAVEAICDAVDGVQVANYNAPGQVVISGTHAGVTEASDRLRAVGAARIVPLPITIAAHSEVMASAGVEFARVVERVPLLTASIPLVANVTARLITEPVDVRDELLRQLTSSVRWTASVRRMLDAGVTAFYEIGPGTVLAGLVKRVLKADGVTHVTVGAMGEPDA